MLHTMSLSTRLFIAVRHCASLRGARQVRYASTCSKYDSDNSIEKSVFISQSTDVFVNLALEHWLYHNFDFSKHHVLLFWKNNPCVVFGRHQNPWLECNVQAAEKTGIALSRRNSGGGTVYHDNGNLNLTFFTPRHRYNRKYNLNIIKNALFRQWGLESVINEREDILINGDFKVSFNVYIMYIYLKRFVLFTFSNSKKLICMMIMCNMIHAINIYYIIHTNISA